MAIAFFDNFPDKKINLNIPLVKPVKTNLVLYGSGFLEPNSSSHNTGDAFKKVAEARHKINQKSNPNSVNEIHYCPTDYDFFNLKGKRTINGKIIDGDSLDWMDKNQDKGKDLRRVEIHEDLYLNSKQKTELNNLHSSVFDTNTEIYFWGCNIGGQLDKNGSHVANNNPFISDPKESFAQEFAVKVGKGNTFALVGKGSAAGSMFKRDLKGNNVYDDGEMIPANISFNHKNKNTVNLKASNYLKKFPL